MRIPVLYIRVSSSKQVQDGGGLTDQLQAGESYIKSVPDLDFKRIVVLKDEGVSSFTGGNLELGMPLRDFVEQRVRLNDGGDYALIVFSIDRISRMNPWAGSQFLGQAIMAGIHIHDISSRQVLRQDDHIGSIISTLNLMRANNESSVKSARRLASIESSLESSLTTGKALKGKLPKWLFIENDQYKINEDIASTIRDAVQMYIDGSTSGEIVKKLNESGRLYGETYWSGPFLIKLFKSKNIMGTYTRIKDGVPLSYDNFYPAIIKPEQYLKLNTIIRSVGKHITKHRVDKGRISNLFSGFILCAECGGVISINRHSGTVKYFTCSNNYRKKTCTAKKGNYMGVERAVLEHIKGLDIPALLSNKIDTSEIENNINEVRVDISELESSIAKRKKEGKRIPIEMLEQLGDCQDLLVKLQESMPLLPLSNNINIGDIEAVIVDTHPKRGLLHRQISDLVESIRIARVLDSVLVSISYRRITDKHVIIIDNSTGRVISAVVERVGAMELFDGDQYLEYPRK
ncbi:recombinase zinc beta ribbon domain-containing protein [Yersinia enterocolitica]